MEGVKGLLHQAREHVDNDDYLALLDGQVNIPVSYLQARGYAVVGKHGSEEAQVQTHNAMSLQVTPMGPFYMGG